ncbi:unnamed protein product [Gadus morhua 'NCC']
MRHGYRISLRHLKRRIAGLGLNRRTGYTNLGVSVDFIQGQLQHSGQLHGYRWMHEKCHLHGLRCAEFWIALFGELKDNGHYGGGFLDKSLIQFCCMGLILVSQSESPFHSCPLDWRQVVEKGHNEQVYIYRIHTMDARYHEGL